jgi:tetratricopeptide (TPR) repeat protein
LAIRGASDPLNAAKGLVNFIKTRPDNFHYYEVAELLGDLAVTLGKFDVAAKYYGDYASAPFPEYKMRGGILEANAMRATEQYADAEKRYEQILGLPVAGPESARLKTLAEIGKAACVAARGNFDEAIAALEKVIATNDPSDAEVFAPAYNAMGFAYTKAGKTMDAVLAYLHVDVLFFNQRNEHAEALYHLSTLWNDLNKPDRAVQARKILAERYAGTVWAKRS